MELSEVEKDEVISRLLSRLKEVEERCEALSARVRELEEVKVRKDERIAELERRLRMSSRNNSKPPSLDGYNRPKPKSRRESSGAEGMC